MTKPVLLYDEDCGFCRRSVRWVSRRAAGRIDLVPLGSPAADELLGPVDPAERMTSWHLVEPDGTVRSAEDAIPEILRLMPRWRFLASPSAVMRRPLGVVYRRVARHRHRIGALLGEEACAVDDPSRAAR